MSSYICQNYRMYNTISVPYCKQWAFVDNVISISSSMVTITPHLGTRLLMGNLAGGGTYRGGSFCGNTVLATQFFCTTKTTLKNKVYIYIYKSPGKSSRKKLQEASEQVQAPEG